jgi:rSAM/selenodomain-associated transferase 2
VVDHAQSTEPAGTQISVTATDPYRGVAVGLDPRDQRRVRLSIVIPVLDEAERLEERLGRLSPLRRRGCEIVIVDGGSRDGTLAKAEAAADQAFAAPRGRGSQMNAGAARARGDTLLFLHADTVLPNDAAALIATAIDGGAAWGRFDVEIAGRHPLLPVVAAMMNARSRLTGIATGDQAMFVRREVFDKVGGFPDIPLMEDIALSAALKRLSRPARIADRVTTSGRRWERNGVIRTIALMWWLRAQFYFGADPARLARRYGYRPREGDA